jgi:hypothetical protein
MCDVTTDALRKGACISNYFHAGSDSYLAVVEAESGATTYLAHLDTDQCYLLSLSLMKYESDSRPFSWRKVWRWACFSALAVGLLAAVGLIVLDPTPERWIIGGLFAALLPSEIRRLRE